MDAIRARWDAFRRGPPERRAPGSEGEPVSEGLELRTVVAEFGPIGCVLAPLALLIFWLWRRSRHQG